MMRDLRPVLWGCLLASLFSFFQPWCKSAFCGTAKDRIRQEKEAFQDARCQEATNYYTKAIEMTNYTKAIEAAPKLVQKQEEWVREMLRSEGTADLLERIDVQLPDDESLPIRKDLIKKYDKELMIRASFLQALIADELNDAKVYRRGLSIKNAIVIGDLDLTRIEIAPFVSVSSCIFLGDLKLNYSFFQRGLNLKGSHFLNAVNASSMKVDRGALLNKADFHGSVNFESANIGGDLQLNDTHYKTKANFAALKVDQAACFDRAVFEGPVDFESANVGGDFEAYIARYESNARFNALQVGQSAVFKDTVFQHMEQIELDGLVYKRIFTGEGNDHTKVLKILQLMKEYRPQPYKQLESYYIGMGYKKAADEVFLKGKESEREAQSNWLSSEFPVNAFKYLVLERGVGYGRFLGWVFSYIIFFIVLGTLVFSRPGIFKDNEKLSGLTAFLYSLGLFLPFVNLGAEKFHEMYKGAYFCALPACLASRLPCWFVMRSQFRVEFYYYVHQLFGYILFSIAFAAMAGIIKVDYSF